MKIAAGIGRQIVVSMVAATVASILMAIAGLYLFYALLMRFAPKLIPTNPGLPTGVEWLMILTVVAAGAGIAFFVAVRLARRIVEPITAVATSVREITHGDVKSRAITTRVPVAEGATLVENFNLLADRLQKASEGIPRWNATIAHELRTPVTILSGRLQGLADGVFQPDPALFRSLVDQVNGLARLIEDLRTVSLMEGGHLDMRFARVTLSREVESIAGLMRPTLTTAGFTLVLELEDFEADVDVSRIRQALLALLENARRHARPSKLIVRLRRANDGVRLEVIDCGPGLPPEFAEHAFEPFRRYLENDDPITGSGLGLSVVLAISKAHGGTALYRNVDGGAGFTMSFLQFQPQPQVKP